MELTGTDTMNARLSMQLRAGECVSPESDRRMTENVYFSAKKCNDRENVKVYLLSQICKWDYLYQIHKLGFQGTRIHGRTQ